jgi:hypothetical protein
MLKRNSSFEPKAFLHPPFPNGREAKTKQASKIAAIRETLNCCGYDTLNKQAEILRLSRSTAWHLLNGTYKASGLSAGMIKRILSSPTLPDRTREVVQEYVREKLSGMYGHNGVQLKRFRTHLYVLRLGPDPS